MKSKTQVRGLVFITVTIIFSLLVFPFTADALPTFSFKGTVSNLGGDFAFLLGADFEVTYTFDPTVTDANPGDPQSGFYPGAITSGSLTVNPNSGPLVWLIVSSLPNSNISVLTTATAHSYFASAALSGPSIGGASPSFFLIQLTDTTKTALVDDSLPTALDIDDFGFIRNLQFTFIGANPSCCSTFGVITSAQTPIPEPSTILLLGSGLAGVGALTRRRRKK